MGSIFNLVSESPFERIRYVTFYPHHIVVIFGSASAAGPQFHIWIWNDMLLRVRSNPTAIQAPLTLPILPYGRQRPLHWFASECRRTFGQAPPSADLLYPSSFLYQIYLALCIAMSIGLSESLRRSFSYLRQTMTNHFFVTGLCLSPPKDVSWEQKQNKREERMSWARSPSSGPLQAPTGSSCLGLVGLC